MLKVLAAVAVLTGLVVLGVVIFIIGSAASAVSSSNRASAVASSDAETAAAARPALEVSPTSLRLAYDQNEVRADAEYRGKTLEISTMVQEIRKDFTDQPVLELFTGMGRFAGITAYMTRGQEPQLAELSIGSPVHLRCIGKGKSIGDPILSDCVLLPAAVKHAANESTDNVATPAPAEVSPVNTEWPPNALPTAIANAIAMPELLASGQKSALVKVNTQGFPDLITKDGAGWKLSALSEDTTLLSVNFPIHATRSANNGYYDLVAVAPKTLRVYRFDGSHYVAQTCYQRPEENAVAPVASAPCE